MTYLQGLIIGIVLFVLGAVGSEKLPEHSVWRYFSFLPLALGSALTLVSGGQLAGKYAVVLYPLLAALCLSVALVGLWKARAKQDS